MLNNISEISMHNSSKKKYEKIFVMKIKASSCEKKMKKLKKFPDFFCK